MKYKTCKITYIYTQNTHTYIYIHPIKLSHIAYCSLQGSLQLRPMNP